MRDIDGDHETIEAVQEPEHQYIAFQECPEWVDDDLVSLAPLAPFEQQLGRQFAIPVILFDMIVKIGIGLVQQIAFKVVDAYSFLHVQPLVNDIVVPMSFSPVDDTQLLIRVPGSIMDELAAIIVHPPPPTRFRR